MQNSFFQRITIEKTLIYILIGAVILTFVFIFYLFFSHFTKKIEITSPRGGEEWQTGGTYKITWESRGIEKVGIVLFKGNQAQWIAKNVFAKPGEYEWKIYPGQEYGSNYWIAIFEYPWKKGNPIDYSDGAFAVVFPEFGTCEGFSAEQGEPYLPSDHPDIRRVFITSQTFTGNLNGLDGADNICKQEARKLGYSGEWMAFIGGDGDEETAVERLKKTKRGTEGIFVQARPDATLVRGATCHRVLGKDFNDFLSIFSALSTVNEKELSREFFEKLTEVWIGRLDASSKKNCISISARLSNPYIPLAEKYSFTATCQNWEKGENYTEGYPSSSLSPFPTCYTPQGRATKAVSLGGFAMGLERKGGETYFTFSEGKSCNVPQRLICIEE